MKLTWSLLLMVFCFCFMLNGIALADESGAEAGGEEIESVAADGAEVEEDEISGERELPDALFWAIGIAMAGGSLAAGYAVGKVGSAALAAAAERPELLGKAIAFVGLGEGIALFGFLISLFLYLKI